MLIRRGVPGEESEAGKTQLEEADRKRNVVQGSIDSDGILVTAGPGRRFGSQLEGGWILMGTA